MIAATAVDRAALLQRYRRNRQRTASIFASVADDAFEERPIPLRHPLAFYEGHIPAFSFLTLNERGLHEHSIDAGLERLFERGIDPSSSQEAQSRQPDRWPDRDRVAEFAAACDERVLDAIESGPIDDARVARLVRAQAAYTIVEHEEMHHETLMYIIHQLDYARKHTPAFIHEDHIVTPGSMRSVGAGIATLGVDIDTVAFAWDNELGRTEVPVNAFDIAQYPVTNGEWLEFVAQGGPVPEFWTQKDGEWHLRLAYEAIPLPKSWPVYVTHRQATAYAAWAGMRLPTEPEYHRAAFGSPAGHDRAFPWGNESPQPVHGNFGFERFDPEPVDAHPAGTSAWGVADLVGNGWEWTSTVFAPFPGFEPMASYPQYSADFFDGKHYVMKGASPVTPRELIRSSFRNWFFDDYPYMYAKFRCVAVSR